MEGIFINSESSRLSSEMDGVHLTLLSKAQGWEVMQQALVLHATVWLTPASLEDTAEACYALSGRFTFSVHSLPVSLVQVECFLAWG